MDTRSLYDSNNSNTSASSGSLADMGVSQNYGYLIGGTYTRDYSIWGSI